MEFIPYAFIAIVLLLVIVIPISINNQIIQLKNLVKRNWADVLAQERMKLKLMPELEKLAKTYQEYEKGLFEKVAALRTTISAIANSDDTGSDSLKKIHEATAQVRGLFTATAEAYPDLKSSDLYLKTMKQLAEVEENVTASIRIYNSSVQEFNSAIQTFPGSFINRNVTRQVAVKEFTDAEAAKDFSYQPNL